MNVMTSPDVITVDPITLQVIRSSFETTAEEMGHVLYRMSFSSIIRESQDLGAGLFDVNFNTLCDSESTPMHIGSTPAYLRGIAETLEDGEWYEGDVVVHNHPYYGSSHTPDLAIAVPVFYQGRLVGFAGNTAHHVDIGAATPGLIIDVPDVFAEGMLFAGTKLYRKGDVILQFHFADRDTDEHHRTDRRGEPGNGQVHRHDDPEMHRIDSQLRRHRQQQRCHQDDGRTALEEETDHQQHQIYDQQKHDRIADRSHQEGGEGRRDPLPCQVGGKGICRADQEHHPGGGQNRFLDDLAQIDHFSSR